MLLQKSIQVGYKYLFLLYAASKQLLNGVFMSSRDGEKVIWVDKLSWSTYADKIKGMTAIS